MKIKKRLGDMKTPCGMVLSNFTLLADVSNHEGVSKLADGWEKSEHHIIENKGETKFSI